MPNDTYQKKRKRLTAKYEPGFLARLDGRCEITKVLTTAFDEICDDAGGIESLSHTQVSLIERFVFLEHILRKMEVYITNNPKKGNQLLSRWIQGLNSLTGLAKAIGLERRLKRIESLESYIVEKQKNGKRKRTEQ